MASHVPMPELLELLGVLQTLGAVFQEEKTLTGINVLLFKINLPHSRTEARQEKPG